MEDSAFIVVFELLDKTARGGNKLLGPVKKIYNGMERTQSLIDKVFSVTKSLDSILGLAKKLANVCRLLSPFPVVGQVLGTVATVLGKLTTVLKPMWDRISHTCDKGLKPLQTKVLPKAVRICEKTGNALLYCTTRVPSWKKAVKTLHIALKAVQVLSRTVFNGTPQAQLLTGISDNIESLSDRASQNLKEIDEGLRTATSTVKDQLASLKKFQEFNEWISPMMNSMKEILDSFQELDTKLQTILDVLFPLKWALYAIGWVSDKIITPAIDYVLELTGLKEYVDNFIKMLEDKLCITDLLERLNETFKPEILEKAVENLKTAEAYISKAKEIGRELKRYKANPRQTLLSDVASTLSGVPFGSFPPPPKVVCTRILCLAEAAQEQVVPWEGDICGSADDDEGVDDSLWNGVKESSGSGDEEEIEQEETDTDPHAHLALIEVLNHIIRCTPVSEKCNEFPMPPSAIVSLDP